MYKKDVCTSNAKKKKQTRKRAQRGREWNRAKKKEEYTIHKLRYFTTSTIIIPNRVFLFPFFILLFCAQYSLSQSSPVQSVSFLKFFFFYSLTRFLQLIIFRWFFFSFLYLKRPVSNIDDKIKNHFSFRRFSRFSIFFPHSFFCLIRKRYDG